ncbi:MAG: hypothetical protein RBU30_03425 [Polyangia bacterium]|nr:hypothetical protein [Polyangia bacterium]
MSRLIRQIVLLAVALLLASASGKGTGAGGMGGPVGAGASRTERDDSLNHPALRVANRTDAPLRLVLEGASSRALLVPPGEVSRTLLPAGEYRYAVQGKGRILRRGALRLARGHRYHLELTL